MRPEGRLPAQRYSWRWFRDIVGESLPHRLLNSRGTCVNSLDMCAKHCGPLGQPAKICVFAAQRHLAVLSHVVGIVYNGVCVHRLADTRRSAFWCLDCSLIVFTLPRFARTSVFCLLTGMLSDGICSAWKCKREDFLSHDSHALLVFAVHWLANECRMVRIHSLLSLFPGGVHCSGQQGKVSW